MSQKQAKSTEDQFTEELKRRQPEVQSTPPTEAASLGDSEPELTATALPVSDESGAGDPIASVSAVDGTAGEAGTAIAAPIPSAESIEVIGDESALYRAMDRYDEVQIIEEIEGRMSEVLVYKIPTGTDLSFAGVREAVRLLVEKTGRKIRIGKVPPVQASIMVNGEEHVQIMVYAEDEASGQGFWGVAAQPVRMKLKDDTVRRYKQQGKKVYDDGTVDDVFAVTKALSKAQRNALKYFIPEQVRQGILAIAKNDPKKLREITMGVGAPAIDAPTPLQDEKGQALIHECNELYKQICRVDPTFKVKKGGKAPGAYHADLKAAWSNHDALESLRDGLLSVLEKVQS